MSFLGFFFVQEFKKKKFQVNLFLFLLVLPLIELIFHVLSAIFLFVFDVVEYLRQKIFFNEKEQKKEKI